MKVVGYAAASASAPLTKIDFERREPAANEVLIAIDYCGVCHSDLHQARNEWHNTVYPCVPGHEIIGRVTKAGASVKKFKVGDRVGVGCMVDSCHRCASCQEGLEQYCETGFTLTYNSPEKGSDHPTFGGYSTAITVREDFVLRIPENLDAAGAAPLLCAGITTYSPLRHWNVEKGDTVGVVGLGGLGHMAIKLAHAMGAKVTLFTTSPKKADDAKKLGADDVLISTDQKAMEQAAERFDVIINTIPTAHDANPYIPTLKRDGTMVMVGCVEPLKTPTNFFPLIFKRRSVAGSLIGGIAETQEMLDFCGQHNIVSDIEVIPMDQINEAYERMKKSDVKYRFVIDMRSLNAA